MKTIINWVQDNKWGILIGILLLIVFWIGRCSRTPTEDPQIDQLYQANQRLQKAFNDSQIKVADLENDIENRNDSIIVLQTQNQEQESEKLQLEKRYLKQVNQLKNLTKAQVDSLFLSRYPGLEEDQIKKIIAQELVEGDKNRELVQIQKRQLLIKDQVIDQKDQIISRMEEIQTELENQLSLKQEEIGNLEEVIDLKDKKIKAVKWQRNGVTGIALVVITLLLI